MTMKFYGADMKGVTTMEKLSSDPSPYVASRDDARIYYQTTQQTVKFGGGSAFQTLDIPSGTVMLFGQSSAPAGWTKKTDWQNNSMLVYTTGNIGNGGSADAKTFNPNIGNAGAHTHAVASHTHGISGDGGTIAEMASHNHEILPHAAGYTIFNGNFLQGALGDTYYGSLNTGSTGGGSTHNHAGATGGAVSTTDNPGNHTHTSDSYAPYYQTIIAAIKD